jgi:hypothetical protein
MSRDRVRFRDNEREGELREASRPERRTELTTVVAWRGRSTVRPRKMRRIATRRRKESEMRMHRLSGEAAGRLLEWCLYVGSMCFGWREDIGVKLEQARKK